MSGKCKVIELTKGYIALVDDDDYDRLSEHVWVASTHEHTVRATRRVPTEDGKRPIVFMHNEVLGVKGIDHITYDLLRFKIVDNRKSNLRSASVSQNAMNRRKNVKRSSRFKGVGWRKSCGKWTARAGNKGCYFLGLFGSEKEAALAYDAKAVEIYGEFALTNQMMYPEDFKETQ